MISEDLFTIVKRLQNRAVKGRKAKAKVMVVGCQDIEKITTQLLKLEAAFHCLDGGRLLEKLTEKGEKKS